MSLLQCFRTKFQLHLHCPMQRIKYSELAQKHFIDGLKCERISNPNKNLYNDIMKILSEIR